MVCLLIPPSPTETNLLLGKTYFLLRLLIRRLVFKLPTAWQIREDCVLLFHETGVHEFKLPKSNEIYGRLPSSGDRKVWALVDSNQSLEVPAGVFTHGPPFFVVEAASPRSPRLHWLRKVNYEPFYMKRWSFSEVLQAYVDLFHGRSQYSRLCSRSFLGNAAPHTESQLWYLYNEFGASPRALANYADKPEIYENEVETQVQSINPQTLRHSLVSQDSDESSHLIIVVDPHPDSRLKSTKTFASQRIFRMLWDKHLSHQTSERRHFYHLLQASSSTTAATGWLLECLMHNLLRRDQTIRLFPVRGKPVRKYIHYDDYSASRNKEGAINLQLPASDDNPLDETTELHVGHYYHPQDTNFPTVDSIFFIHPPGEPPILLMFQVTCSRVKHGVDLDGLERIKKLLPSGVRTYFVVVTPTNVMPRIEILKTYFKDEDLQVLNAENLSEVFPVFHYPVDEETLYQAEQPSHSGDRVF